MTDSLFKKRVRDAMSRDVVTMHVRGTVHEALQMMAENRVSTLPVVDNKDKCLGVISASDLMEVTAKVEYEVEELDRSGDFFYGHVISELAEGLGHRNVMDMMSEDVVSVAPDDLLVEAANRMLKDGIHRLPVIEGDRVAGIISTTDVLGAFVDSASEVAT